MLAQKRATVNAESRWPDTGLYTASRCSDCSHDAVAGRLKSPRGQEARDPQRSKRTQQSRPFVTRFRHRWLPSS